MLRGESTGGIFIESSAIDLLRVSCLLTTELNIDSRYVISFDGDFKTLDPVS
jgi:hypothetical protein